ncbi:MAG: segregation/condensation protein A [Clostridium perfringens]|nr:segregation/condensation protein A [Clostridium perfringens]
MDMPIIKLQNFDGPFDLLLHLIKKNKMSINDVKIHDITRQYLNYIKLMKELDLEITSEFIVLAATLIEIKSKSLLPKIEIEENEKDEKDLIKELKGKLIEYKKFKKIALFFKDKEGNGGIVFTKKPEIIEDVSDGFNENYLKNISMVELYDLYNDLIKKHNEKQNINTIERKINVDKYRIEDKIDELKATLQDKNVIKFSKISDKCTCKLEIVVTFLALLELIKDNFIKVLQYDTLGEIIIEKQINGG